MRPRKPELDLKASMVRVVAVSVLMAVPFIVLLLIMLFITQGWASRFLIMYDEYQFMGRLTARFERICLYTLY